MQHEHMLFEPESCSGLFRFNAKPSLDLVGDAGLVPCGAHLRLCASDAAFRMDHGGHVGELDGMVGSSCA